MTWCATVVIFIVVVVVVVVVVSFVDFSHGSLF